MLDSRLEKGNVQAGHRISCHSSGKKVVKVISKASGTDLRGPPLGLRWDNLILKLILTTDCLSLVAQSD